MAEQTPIKTAAKTTGIASTIILMLTQLPEPYAHWASIALMVIGVVGLIGTQIPAPDPKSRWMIPYQALSFLAANWGQAINASLAARSHDKK